MSSFTINMQMSWKSEEFDSQSYTDAFDDFISKVFDVNEYGNTVINIGSETKQYWLVVTSYECFYDLIECKIRVVVKFKEEIYANELPDYLFDDISSTVEDLLVDVFLLFSSDNQIFGVEYVDAVRMEEN